MEGSRPALPAQPGTLKATLPDTPGEFNSLATLLSATRMSNIFATIETLISESH